MSRLKSKIQFNPKPEIDRFFTKIIDIIFNADFARLVAK